MFQDNYDYSNIVIILGGPFQGKSLISIKIAERYLFSGVLGTDCFRNILRVQNPEENYLCSTSKLDKHLFNKQKETVSELLHKTLQFYVSRKEKIVIEGIHFTKEFLEHAIKRGAKCFYLNNQLSWERKVNLKRITTPVTKIYNLTTKEEEYVYHDNYLETSYITYVRDEEVFESISNIISNDVETLKIEEIKFKYIDEALEVIFSKLDKEFFISEKWIEE